MGQDSYVQLDTDGGGKKVDMDLVVTAAGSTIYRQKAVLVAETADLLQQLYAGQQKQLACLRAILQIIRSDHPDSPGEDDFKQDVTPNDY